MFHHICHLNLECQDNKLLSVTKHNVQLMGMSIDIWKVKVTVLPKIMRIFYLFVHPDYFGGGCPWQNCP